VQPIDIPEHAFSHMHVDLLGPLPSSSEGHSYVLTIIDRTTRWPEAIPLKSISAQSVADAFTGTWVAHYGVHTAVTTDQGTQFSGAIWQCMCRTLGIKHMMTTSYHPQGNGIVERFH